MAVVPAARGWRLKRIGTAVTCAALVVIGSLTLFPNPAAVTEIAKTSFLCLICGDVGAVDVLLNIALFVPLGVGLGLAGRRFATALLIALAATATIEFLQATIIVGRDSSISDIITNTAGGGLGWVLARHAEAVIRPHPALARRLAIAAVVAWLAMYAFSAWGLATSPAAGTYWGQWTHHFEGGSTYNGRVLDAALNGVPLPDDQLRVTETVRSLLASQEFDLMVHATSSEPYEEAQIFGIANDRGDIFLEWRQDGQDYLFRLRSRSAKVLLRSTAVRIRHIAPWKIGDPITLQLRRHRGVLTATVDAGARGHASHAQPLTPGLGWTFLWPFRQGYTGWTPLWSMAWMFASFFPVAFWTGQARSSRLTLGVAAVVAAGIFVLSPLFHLPAARAGDWLAVGASFLVAAAISRRFSLRETAATPGRAGTPAEPRPAR